MITRLFLKNFRQHAETELFFTPEDQLIVISGSNGSGKSTLIEGIMYAFYGETRHGRRGLTAAVRRGAELEGLDVECEFSVASTHYRVSRRHVDGKTSAVLTADGVPIAESVREVNAQIAAIVGMDSSGFKAAAFAGQQELAGLTSANSAERRKTLSRLLHVEQVGKAANTAGDKFNFTSKALSAIDPQDITDLTHTAEAADKAAEVATAEAVEATTALDAIRAELEASAQVEEDYNTAVRSHARLQGAHDSALAARIEAGDTHSQITVPPMPGNVPDLSEARDAMTNANAALASAEKDLELAASRKATESDLASAQERVGEIDSALAKLGASPESDASHESAISDSRSIGQKLRDRRNELATKEGQAELELAQAAEAAMVAEKSTNTDGATCQTCGQDITPEHAASELEKAKTNEAQLTKRLEVVREKLAKAETELQTALSDHAALEAHAKDMAANTATAHALTAEKTDLEIRISEYEARLGTSRDGAPGVDLDEVREAAAQTAAAFAAAERINKAAAESKAAAALKAAAKEKVVAAAELVTTAETALAAAQPSKTLVAAFDERKEQLERRDAESELVAALRESAAEYRAQAVAAREALADATKRMAKRNQLVTEATRAALVKDTLKNVHAQLSAELRPSLELRISEILDQLSDGRFSDVTVASDYEVTVRDGRSYQKISELSGGEQDLVAVATRLALSAVVAERHGADAMGLLILDEVFGSQDSERRDLILSALRRLRGTYKQIFAISHVEQLPDCADKTINVHTNETRTETTVRVTSTPTPIGV